MTNIFKRKKLIAIITSVCMVASVCLAGTTDNSVFAEEKGQDIPEYKDGEVIVVFEDEVEKSEAEDVVEDMDGTDTEILSDDSEVTALVDLPEEQTVEEAVKEYEKNPEVAYVQPNFKYETMGGINTSSTSDKYYNELWHFGKVNVEGAWNQLSGINAKKTRVAVLDTGVDLSHPDLKANLNIGLCRDTSNGKTTVSLKGDDDGHGTHVSGIIAATANNGIGVAGVASAKNNKNDSLVELFVVDVFVTPDAAYTSGVVRGINYAKSAGAKVINMSLGYYSYSVDKYMKSAVDSAVSKNIAVVCAAGNGINNVGVSHVPNYPSDLKASIGVISTDSNGRRSGFSNFGTAKNISAPGEDIRSTYRNSTYKTLSGTSMASPVVAGTAAMVYSANPNLKIDEVKRILYRTATDVMLEGKDPETGYGNVNANDAVKKAIATRNVTSVKISSLTLGIGKKAKLTPVVGPRSAVDKSVTWTSSNPAVATVDSAGNVTGIAIGSAKITATSKSNPTVSGSSTVTIGHNIRYVLNGGKNSSSNPAAYKTGSKVKLKNPTRKSYTFKGWYGDSKFKTKVTTVSGGDKTVYAKWQKVTVGKTAITRIKRSSNKMTVRYKKVKDARGYEIKYSTNKKFYKSTTKTSLTKQMPKTLTVKKGTKYHVKIRAFKKDSTGRVVYGKYCKVKSK